MLRHIFVLILFSLSMNLFAQKKQFQKFAEISDESLGLYRLNPTKIDIDKNSILYVSSGNIKKFSTNGVYLGSIEIKGGIVDFEISEQNHLFILQFGDSLNYILKFTLDGVLLNKWSCGETCPGYSYIPGIGIATDKYENVYLSDEYNRKVEKYNSEGKLISKINPFLQNFRNIKVDQNGYIYIEDHIGQFISVQDSNLNHISTWSTKGLKYEYRWNEICECSVNYWSGLTIDKNNFLYVGDYNHRLQKYTKNGDFVLQVGDVKDSIFYNPNGIAVDTNGFIYVCDTGNNRIEKFNSKGQFILKWGIVVPKKVNLKIHLQWHLIKTAIFMLLTMKMIESKSLIKKENIQIKLFQNQDFNLQIQTILKLILIIIYSY